MASTSLTFMLRLRARAGLPDHQREFLVVPAGEHLVGRAHDRLAPSSRRAGRASALTRAAARFTSASAWITASGMRSPEMRKKRRLRSVCAPHRRSAGTSIGPKESFSMRVPDMEQTALPPSGGRVARPGPLARRCVVHDGRRIVAADDAAGCAPARSASSRQGAWMSCAGDAREFGHVPADEFALARSKRSDCVTGLKMRK